MREAIGVGAGKGRTGQCELYFTAGGLGGGMNHH